jgi:simple sugar transport system permease protein
MIRRALRASAWPLSALGLLLLFDALFVPAFFSATTAAIVAERSAPLAIVALGMTLVIATRGVDLSVGATMAIAGSLCAWLAAPVDGVPPGAGWPAAAAMAAAMTAGVIAGAFNGTLVAFARVQPIVATLILMVAGRGIALMISDGQKVPADQPTFELLGGLGAAVGTALAILAVAAAATRATAMGLFVESVGDNERAARIAGIGVGAVTLAAYVWAGICAGAAGLLVMADIAQSDPPNAGLYWELDAILAVVIGGTSLRGGRFFLVGSVVGAVLIQSLNMTILMLGVRPEATLIVKAAVVLAVCLLQSPAFRAAVSRPAARRWAA